MKRVPAFLARPRLLRGGTPLAASGLVLLALCAFGVNRGERPASAAAPTSAAVAPPAHKDVVVLFSGRNEDLEKHWVRRRGDAPGRWKVSDGAMEPTGGDIMSRQRFSDFQLHVEFREPSMPQARGQAKGNSGVFLQGRYEIQVLDSYGIADPGRGDCGAVYDRSAPLLNACKPPLEWQTYDILFRAPRANPTTHQVTEPARVTVIQNGITIQNNQEITGVTGAAIDEAVDQPGPILLQDHGYPVAYRNVWVLPLPPRGAQHY
jgi:Domain of Unknown Function (DUF1080)